MSTTLVRVDSPRVVLSIRDDSSRGDGESSGFRMTGSQLIRVDSPEIVMRMARANHVSYTLTPHAASVTLSGSVCYFWAA